MHFAICPAGGSHKRGKVNEDTAGDDLDTMLENFLEKPKGSPQQSGAPAGSSAAGLGLGGLDPSVAAALTAAGPGRCTASGYRLRSLLTFNHRRFIHC